MYERSIKDPVGFWAEVADCVTWYRKWDKVLDDTNPPFYRWFVGGELNTCYNALDRHVENGCGDQVAIIYDSPVTGVVKNITYREALAEVERFAGALKSLGVVKGNTVIIYMPNIWQALIAMLSCARLGAIHSVVFGGFAPHELAFRIEDARPKVIVSASCGIEGSKIIAYKPLLDMAIEMSSHKPEKCVILARPQAKAELKPGRDLDWAELMERAEPADCVAVKATDPLYILYTSGTTGKPKGVVRDNGGHAVAMCWSMRAIYGVEPGEVFWAASDVGWQAAHSYIVYSPLISGSTTVVYEGKPIGTPDAGAFWRVISQHKVKAMFTAPTALRAIRKEDHDGEFLKKYDISCFKTIFPAGERLDPDTYYWTADLLKIPVVDHYWQTETGWPVACDCVGIEVQPVKPGSPTKAVPGYDIRVFDESGKELGPNQQGALVIKSPLPPGSFLTLWNAEEQFVNSYFKEFPGYYLTGDGGFFDEDGYLFVMGRIDDVINVAGHRLSTGEMEEIISTHPAVAECAVVGAADSMKGQVPIGLVVLRPGVFIEAETLSKELVKMVREDIGPIACYKETTIVHRLPKTRSGKILRTLIRELADGNEVQAPATIEDTATLGEIASAFRDRVSVNKPIS